MLSSNSVIDSLACPTCGGFLESSSSDNLTCKNCSSVFSSDGVVDLLVDKSLRSALEDADYDAKAGYNDDTISKIGKSWLTVFDHAGIDIAGKNLLEIGAGTGALTLALLRARKINKLFATDISDEFLRMTVQRADGATELTALRCDCNNIPVQNGCFDLIIGRSILHHLLDYEQVLGQCARVLNDGGKAIFFEPILEGKLVVAMFAAMVVDLAQRDGDDNFSSQELNKIQLIVRHITKESWYPQSRQELAKLEDKYIFTLPGMREKGIKAGFSKAEVVKDDRVIDPSFWPNFISTMKLGGIAPEKFQNYKILSDSYARTFGAFEELTFAPMAYFCFTK